jgi:hypothetical protein
MMDFVSWDDDIPNVNGKIKAMFQTTNQMTNGLLVMTNSTVVAMMGYSRCRIK